jgi:hypothetical protein
MSDILDTTAVATAELNYKLRIENEAFYKAWSADYRSFRERLRIRLLPDFHVRFEAVPDFDDFRLSSLRQPDTRIWGMRLFNSENDSIGLIWLGYCSEPMSRHLENMNVQYTPSLYFDLDNPNPELKQWVTASNSTDGQFSLDEISLVVPDQANASSASTSAAVRFFNSADFNSGKKNRFHRGNEADVTTLTTDQAIDLLAGELRSIVDYLNTTAETSDKS